MCQKYRLTIQSIPICTNYIYYDIVIFKTSALLSNVQLLQLLAYNIGIYLSILKNML